MKRLSVSPPPSETCSLTPQSTPSASPAARAISSFSYDSNNKSTKTSPKALWSLTCCGFSAVIACGFAFYSIFLLTISLHQQLTISKASDSRGSIFKLWIESLDAANVNVYSASNAESFLQSGIDGILKNFSALVTLDPFSPSNYINAWDLFPPSVSCPDIKRLGRVGDGGKWVCGLSKLALQPRGNCVVYSFGISNDASFEEELLQTTNCTIHAFDPSIGGLPRSYFINEFRWDALQKTRIFFHKYALSEKSGSSSMHSMTVNLFDFMHQHDHNFVDIVKVDIEGAEWNLLKKMFAYMTTSDIRKLPVGQILIEFHYKSMLLTKQVIEGLNAFGFQSFSREINLQPCINGGKPVAAEYSFINPKHFLDRMISKSADLSQYPIPAAVTPSWHLPVSGLIYILTKQSRFEILKFTLSELYNKVWRWHSRYPVIIFHDDLDEYHQTVLQATLSDMPLTYYRVNFTLPSHLNPSLIPNRTECAPASSTIGYRYMCRFHATQIHEIVLSMPQYASVEYILRLDDDSLFTKPIGYDLFHFMKTNRKLYGFVNILGDDRRCVKGLWNATRSFLSSSTARRVSGFQRGYDRNHSFFEEWEEPNVFYNNFEISHMSIWKNPLWKAFMSYIDETGGIFFHRWGDAPIHTIGVSLVLSKMQMHSFSDIGYKHFPFVEQSARGLPMPSSDPFIPIHSQDCKYYAHWSCSGLSGNGSFQSKWNRTKMSYPSVSQGQAVLFTFSRQGSENALADTILNFHENYLANFPRPVVIFYSRDKPINNAIFFRKISSKHSSLAKYIHFHGVDLRNFSSPESTIDLDCGSASAQFRAVSYFLRYEVFALLNGYYGYEWFIRIGDSSTLHAPIDFDLIDFLIDQKKRYAYANTIREYSKCISSLWHSTASFCSQRSNATDTCQLQYFSKWPRHVVFYTNFEISHISLWNSTICRRHLSAIEVKESGYDSMHDSFELLSPNNQFYPKYGDAALHTICVILSLKEEEVHHLEEVHYTPKVLSDKNTSLLPASATVQSVIIHPIPLDVVDQKFYPRRFGWLGGDVCASIALPRPDWTHLPASVDYVWLFGDSLIGTSTERKRSEGVLISNSVAIAKLSNDHISSTDNLRSIESIRMFWRSDDQGTPLPIFQPVSRKHNSSSELLFWPLGGISIQNLSVDSSTSTVLVIIGHFVESYLSGNPENQGLKQKTFHIIQSLAFHELSCSLIRVINPNDSPDAWKYEVHDFPTAVSGAQGNYKWFAAADASGRLYSTIQHNVKDRMIFLIGSYSPVNTTAYEAHRDGAHGYFDPYQVSLHESYQVVGRISAAALMKGDLDQLEIRCSSFEWQAIRRGCEPQALFSPRITEASFHFDSHSNRWIIVSLQVGEEAIQICESVHVEGPWQCKRDAKVPSQSNNSSVVITYGAKAHPELVDRSNGSDEMVISLISNAADDFLSLFEDGNRLLYTPKFYRLRKTIPA